MHRILAALAAVIVLAIVGVAGYVLATDDPDFAPPKPPPTLEVPDGPPVVPDRDNEIQPDELENSGSEEPEHVGPSIHEDARDETPPGVTREDADRIPDAPTQGVGPRQPLGGAQNYSCRRNLVRNRSSRGGARVVGFVLHYTVSRPGSLRAIWGLFNTPSFGASSNLLLEGDGECELIVPYAEKAWTQGAFNPVVESVEIIAYGDEPRSWWLRQPIIRDGILAAIVRDRLRANGLPLRRVNPSGCAFQKAGWTDHDALECGNNHHDVKPAFPYDVLSRQIKQGSGPKPAWELLLAKEKQAVSGLRGKRRIAKRNGGWKRVSPRHLQEAVAFKDRLRSYVRGYRRVPAHSIRAARRVYMNRVIAGN